MPDYADTPVTLARPPEPYPLRPYRPDGAVTPPLVLIEGDEFAGKSWAVAEFTGHPMICRTWWIEWGQTPTARQYGQVPGADYEIVPHDGSFWSVLSLLEQLTVQARELVSRDGAPMVVIDGAGSEWKALCDLAHYYTMAAPSVVRRLTENPAARAERFPIHQNTWTEVNRMHSLFMRLLRHFPGVAVLISRGRQVTAVDDDGALIPGEKTYRVDGQRDLPFDCTAWVRMTRTGHHTIIGALSMREPLRPGVDEPRPFLGLDQVVFDVLGYEPQPWEPDLHRETLRQFAAGEPRPVDIDWAGELDLAVAIERAADRREALSALWKAANFQHRQFGTVGVAMLARINAAGSKAAEAAAREWNEAWTDAEEEQVRLATPAAAPDGDQAADGVSAEEVTS